MNRRQREILKLADEAYQAGIVRGASLMMSELKGTLPSRQWKHLFPAFLRVYDQRTEWPK